MDIVFDKDSRKHKAALSMYNDEGLRIWNKYQKGNSIQQTFTPLSLVLDMISKLETLNGKDILVIANVEIFSFLKTLKKYKHIDYKTLTFLTDIELLRGKDGIIVENFNKISDISIDMKYDVIIGNPPYQETESKAKRAGTPLWHKFVLKSYELLQQGGHLSMIHPNGWRNKRAKFKKVLELFNSANPLFISLSNYATGLRIFNVGTTCDWYVLQKALNEKNTTVRDVDGIESSVDMSSLELLPDSNLEECFKYLASPSEERVEIVFSQTAYYTPLAHMSKEKTDTFKHPIAYTITQKNGLNFWWSSDNTRGQFGVPKVIVSKGAGCYPIIDLEGDYGLTQFTYAIADKKETLPKIEEALKSEKFLKLMKDLGSGNDRYTREALSLLKKDFWKDFI
jgi:hypothetical protein